ncbi:MAG TPA: AMP-binding protein [Trebonia sp.]|nr:AMP-binding protein [Trebonia sp.]
MTEGAGTVWSVIEAAAREHPGRVLFSDDYGRRLTAAQLRESAEAVAAGMALQPGQVVSWQLPTVLEAPVLLAALARVGAVQNPLITILREREIGLITRQVGCSTLVVPEVWRGFPHAEMARGLGLDVVALNLNGEAENGHLRLPMGDPASLPPPPTSASDVRWIYFSSGTTSDPKGIRHTDASVIASSYGVTDRLGAYPTDIYPIAWPYAHIGGATMTLAVLRRGGCLVLFESFDPLTTPERMAAHRPTILGSATPFFCAYLDAQRRHGNQPLFPALRAFSAGGAPTPDQLVVELSRTFGAKRVLNSWGLTEFPVATGLAADDPPDKVAATAGRPSPGVTVRVVDGELRLKGPQCFDGYVDLGLNAAAFDEQGWLRSGDLGTIDSDGFVTVTGRVKDVVIRNAENVSALEVENTVLDHPDVVEVAVVGLPDQRTGERVCAVVVARLGAKITIDALAAHCRAAGLARYKTPEQIETVSELPRNAMGKVLKDQLVARFR